MKILLDETKLNLLLEQKKQFIGNKVIWDSVLSSISFLTSVLLASYGDFCAVPGIVLKTTFAIMGVFFCGKSIIDVRNSRANSYSHEDLFADIKRLNEIAHNHSIIAIKDSFRPFSNRFLLCYEPRWGCYLFPSFKDNINNEAFIKSGISNRIKIKPEDIQIEYLAQTIHEKQSKSHGDRRVYSHRLFSARLFEFPKATRADAFSIDGIDYKWMSIVEMEQDGGMMEANADVITFVKENCN